MSPLEDLSPVDLLSLDCVGCDYLLKSLDFHKLISRGFHLGAERAKEGHEDPTVLPENNLGEMICNQGTCFRIRFQGPLPNSGVLALAYPSQDAR